LASHISVPLSDLQATGGWLSSWFKSSSPHSVAAPSRPPSTPASHASPSNPFEGASESSGSGSVPLGGAN
jgi:hypothetical protein